MLRHWSKQHLLTIGLNALHWRAADNSLQSLPVKITGKQLLPDLTDLAMQLELLASPYLGQAVTVHISQPLMRYQILAWQKSIVRQRDWLTLARQCFLDIYGPVAHQWAYQIHFQGYGQPVLAMATDAGLLALIDEQSKKFRWQLKGVESELLALMTENRRLIKTDDWLLIGHSANYALLAERQNQRLQAVHVFTTSPASLKNSVEALLRQRQQSYTTLPALTVWTHGIENLPLNLAGLSLKPLRHDLSSAADHALPGIT